MILGVLGRVEAQGERRRERRGVWGACVRLYVFVTEGECERERETE